MQISVMIVDDEPLAQEAIALRLSQHSNFKIVGFADNGNDAVLLANQLKPDVIFLDIEMPELTGIEAAKLIAKTTDSLIVFATAYQHFAVDAFRVNAVDYLLKPIDDEQFNDAISRLADKIKSQNVEAENKTLQQVLDNFESKKQTAPPKYLKRLTVEDGDNRLIINIDEIESFTVAKNYLCILYQNNTYLKRGTITEMEELLDSKVFIKVSRSQIVNIDTVTGKINQEGKTFVKTKAGNLYAISRRMMATVNRLLKAI